MARPQDIRNIQNIFAGGAGGNAPPVAGEDVARINRVFLDYGGAGQYDRTGATSGVSSGPSINWGAIGGNILKSLSVPQAAAGTVLYKTARAGIPLPLIGPVGTAGLNRLFKDRGDISWKNIGGDFYDPEGEEFERGNDNVFSKLLGTNNKYAIMGAQLVFDPTWAVGITKLPAAAKAGTTAAQALNASDEVTRSIKVLLGEGLTKAGKPGYTSPGPLNRRLMVRGLTATPRVPNKLDLAKAIQLKRTSFPVVSAGKKPILTIKKGDKAALARAFSNLGDEAAATRIMRTGRLAGRTEKIKVGKKMVTARILRGRYAVTLAKKADGAPYYQIFDLGADYNKAEGVTRLGASRQLFRGKEPDSIEQVRALLQRFLVDAEAQSIGKATRRGRKPRYRPMPKRQRKQLVRVLTQVGKAADETAAAAPASGAAAPLREAMSKALGNPPNTAQWVPKARQALPDDPYAVDQFLNPMNLKKALSNRKDAAIEQFGQRQQLAINVGGREGLNIKLPFYINKKGFSHKKGGVFGLKPLQKAAHTLVRAGDEVQTAADRNTLMAAKAFGMAEEVDGVLRFKEQPAVLTGVVRSVRNALDNETAEAVKDFLRGQGLWSKQHDDVFQYMDDRYEVMAQQDFFAGDVQKHLKKLKKDVEDGVPDAENQLRDFVANMEGRYTTQAQRLSQTHARRQEVIEEYRSGQRSSIGQRRFQDDAESMKADRDLFRNPFTAISPEQFIDDMVATGMERDAAIKLMSIIDNAMSVKTGERFAKEQMEKLPEWNALELLNLREKQHVMIQVEQQIDELIEIAVRDYGLPWDLAAPSNQAKARGIAKYDQERTPAIVRALKYGVDQNHPGSIRHWRPADWVLREGMPFFKNVLTTINPAHFVSNAYGDFRNGLINGNWRHAVKGAAASIPRTAQWKLGKAGFRHSEDKINGLYKGTGGLIDAGDEAALNKVWDLGNGRTMTGGELDMMSRMVGLGRGYHTADIGDLVGLFNAVDKGNGRSVMKWMARRNVNRENAQRIITFVRHIQNGDDPILAGAKTVRVHFDYSELSDFEKLVLRNTLLFYTWLKKNAVLQATGIATRPGLYNTLNTTEGAREKYLNEPDYFRMQGAIPTPIGNLVMPGDPYQDIHKFDVGWESFRKNVLGAVNPLARVPVEVGLNRTSFTGGEVKKYEGELKQTPLASALMGLGLGPIPGLLDTTRNREGGEFAPGIPAVPAYIMSQFLGPQHATAAYAMNPDNNESTLRAIIGRITGLGRFQVNDAEKFERNAKIREAKKKADATRARNAQGG